MKITINGNEYTITREATPEYRSSRVEPNNWIAMYLTDGEDEYIAWYYVENIEDVELENVDYETPHDVEKI